MTLVSRVSAFFLTVLALALLGFSVGLYLLARNYLHRQLNDHLTASVHSVVSSIEIDANGLGWYRDLQPSRLGNLPTLWRVFDSEGSAIAGSHETNAEELFSLVRRPTQPGALRRELVDHRRQNWWVLQRHLTGARGISPAATSELPFIPDEQDEDDDDEPLTRYDALTIAAAVPLGGTEQTLRSLVAVTGMLSVGLWLVAATIGRSVCRRTLSPMAELASAARSIDVLDLPSQLPLPGTGDELDELAVAFNDLFGRLREAVDRERRFAGEASHQLRTPLTGLLGQIEVTLRRERSGKEYRDTLVRAKAQAEELRRIVEALLFLARQQNDTSAVDLVSVDLRAWLESHVDTLRARYPVDAQLQCDVQGECLVKVQLVLLGQLIDNLFDNAVKYAGCDHAVIVRLGGNQVSVFVEVEDRGPGIDEHEIPMLFKSFYRTAESRRKGTVGLGLGLAVADRIARAFSGTLAVRSRKNAGSCFRVTLPREHASSNRQFESKQLVP